MVKDIGSLNGQLAMLQAQMAEIGRLHDVSALDKPRGVNGQRGMRQMLNETGAFRVEALKATSATELFTNALRKQDVSLNKLVRSRTAMNDVLREQYRIQNMSAMGWTMDARNRISADMIIPKEVPARLTSFRKSMAEVRAGTASFSQILNEQRLRLGVWSQAVKGGANQMINWGKNTQWAGRQLMVGFTVPFVAFAAISAKLYNDVDKNLTKIVRVYDFASKEAEVAGKKMIMQDNLRAASLRTARQAVATYGVTLSDTLDVTAQLAAAGRTGNELQADTLAVQRASSLGQMDYNDTVKATIALQQAFGYNAAETADAFNYMNAMENGTVLSMKDFIEAIPRSVGILAQLGGNLQEVGTMMTAMRAGAIEAAQGANALKAAAARIIDPNPAAVTYLKNFHIDLAKIAAEAKGNVLPTLIELAKQMEAQGLGAEEQARAMKEMFGVHQFGRLNTIVASLRKINEEGNQMKTAFDIGEAGPAEWAKVAAGELTTLQESASFKFKAAIEGMKGELATAGKPFLEFAADAAGVLKSILGFFNGLSGGQKKFLLWAAAIMAIVGPLIMITGLFANFIGQIIRTGAVMLQASTGMKIFGMEEKLAALVAKQASSAFRTEAQSADLIAQAVNRSNLALREQINLQRQQMGLPMVKAPKAGTYGAGQVWQTKGGNYRTRDAEGGKTRAAKDAEVSAARTSGTLVANSEKVKRNAESTTKAIGGFAMGVGMLGSMATHSGTMANNFSVAAMYVGMMSMMMPGMFAKMGASVIATGTKVGGLLAKSKALAPVLNLAKKGMVGIGAAAGPIGIAVAGIAVSAYLMHKAISETRKETERANQSAQDWAKVLGFAYVEADKFVGLKPGSTMGDLGGLQIKKFRDANKQAAEELASFSGTYEEKMARVIEEGVRVKIHGGSTKDAKEAAAVAWQTMTKVFQDKAEKDDFFVNIDARINFDNAANVAQKQLQIVAQQFKGVFNDEFDESNRETVARWFMGDNDMNARAGQEIKDSVNELYELYRNAAPEDKTAIFDSIKETMMSGLTDSFKNLDDDTLKALKDAGMETPDKMFAKWADQGDKAFDNLGMSNEVRNRYLRSMDAIMQGLRQMGKNAGLTDKAMDGMDFKTLADALGVPEDAAAAIQQVKDSAIAAQAALVAAGGSVEDFFAQADGKQLGEALTSTWSTHWSNIMDEASRMGEDAHQEALDNTAKANQDALDKIDADADIREKEFDNRSKSLDKAYDNKEKVFESRWETTMNKHATAWKARMKTEGEGFDNRIKKIDDAIKAEQDAESIRQKIFEAEKSRVQRMAEMYNSGVDVNMALNSGNMDEAAKLINNARATQAQWALDDAGAGAADASSARQDQLEKSKEPIEAERTKRMDYLEWLQTAEENVLKRKQDREKEALDLERQNAEEALAQEKERYQKSVDNHKKAMQEKQAAAEKAAQKEYDASKRALDLELADIKAFIPSTVAERNEQIAKLEKAYAAHGVKLKLTGQEWSKYVTDSMNAASASAQAALANDIKWKQIAENAANQMTSAFGMTKDEFMAWVTTGKMPTSAAEKQGQLASDGSNWILPSGKKIPMPYHEGGFVDPIGGSGRTGVSNMNSRLPSEVDTRLKVGEYVVKKKAASKLGRGVMDMINEGRMPAIGGGNALGPAGMMGGAMSGLIKTMAMGAVRSAFLRKAQEMAALEGFDLAGANAGQYGQTKFGNDQMQNAATIIGVGRGMGASDRDLVIALMTSMQESGLKNINYGDRDSVGLFQQRTSQGWGTIEQIMDPKYSSRKFFEGLFGIKGRDKMPLTAAAQAVQRSAFPNAYAKWEDEARAILAAQMGGGGTANWDAGKGNGLAMPLRGAITSHYGMRTNPVTGRYVLHNGADIAAPVGTPIHAAAGGTVLRAGPASGYGNWTVLGHPGGMQTGYAHQSQFAVRPGQKVNKGQVIGFVGMTGNTTGPHLHFQTGMNGNWSNPGQFIPGLKIGGNVTSEGIANLHEKETVLTAPLSEDLKRGIRNLDQGAGTTYNVTMDLRGAYIKEDIDIEGALDKALAKKEGRVGVKRKIT